MWSAVPQLWLNVGWSISLRLSDIKSILVFYNRPQVRSIPSLIVAIPACPPERCGSRGWSEAELVRAIAPMSRMHRAKPVSQSHATEWPQKVETARLARSQ